MGKRDFPSFAGEKEYSWKARGSDTLQGCYVRRTSTHPETFGFPLPRGGFALRYERAKHLGKLSKLLWLYLNCAARFPKNQLRIQSLKPSLHAITFCKIVTGSPLAGYPTFPGRTLLACTLHCAAPTLNVALRSLANNPPRRLNIPPVGHIFMA